MESREPTIPTEVRYDGSCDESKCISEGTGHLYGWETFTCYGDGGTFYPMRCADGFLPIVVEDEPPALSFSWYPYHEILPGFEFSSELDVPVKYFTCCPPNHSPDQATNVSRHCSDPINSFTEFQASDGPIADDFCLDQDTRKYPRHRNSRSWSLNDYLVCCDSEDDEDINAAAVTNNFLDESECVPYRNENYENALALPNRWGKVAGISLISCRFSGQDNFAFPRPISEDLSNDVVTFNEGHLWYQCCRNGPGMAPFISDSAFKITVYPMIAVYFTATVISFIVGMALLIPLLIQLKDGRCKKATGRRNGKPQYSTYNLYLVYIALVDLFYALSNLVVFSGMANQTFYDSYWTFLVDGYRASKDAFNALESLLFFAHGLANVLINAITAYEIFILLRSTNRAQRVKPPSLRRVNMQVAPALLFSVLSIFLGYSAIRLGLGSVFLLLLLLVGVVILASIVFGIVLSILVQWRGYIPSSNGSTPRDKAVRGLAFFFFRIAVTFTIFFLPCTLVFYVALPLMAIFGSDPGITLLFSIILFGLQPIFTFCMILTKPDVKQYIKDFVTLKYIFGDCTCNKKTEPVKDVKGTASSDKTRIRSSTNEIARTDPAHPITTNQGARRKTISIFGYTFVDDDDSDVQAEAGVDVEQNLDITTTNVVGDCVPIDSMVYDDDHGDTNDSDGNSSVDNDIYDIADANVGSKVGKYESRRVRGGPASVLATGKAVPMGTQAATTALMTAPATVTEPNDTDAKQ